MTGAGVGSDTDTVTRDTCGWTFYTWISNNEYSAIYRYVEYNLLGRINGTGMNSLH